MLQHTELDFTNFCQRSGKDPFMVDAIRETFNTKGSWLGGGAIRRTLMGMPLDSDFDFFFENEDSLGGFSDNAIAAGLKQTKETEHHQQFEGDFEGEQIKVQAIKFQYYKTPVEVIDSFDYTITMFALQGDTLYTTPESLWDLGRKRLALNKVTYPVSTLRRMLKYSRQGFTACSGCMSDLFKMTVENPSTWETFDIQYID